MTSAELTTNALVTAVRAHDRGAPLRHHVDDLADLVPYLPASSPATIGSRFPRRQWPSCAVSTGPAT